MSNSEVESNHFLFKCAVCLNDYGESLKQKFLPCLHSFCFSCLTEIKQASGIKCPICRKLHVVSGDVSSLPSNYFEALKKIEREVNERMKDEIVLRVEARIREIDWVKILQLEQQNAEKDNTIRVLQEHVAKLERALSRTRQHCASIEEKGYEELDNQRRESGVQSVQLHQDVNHYMDCVRKFTKSATVLCSCCVELRSDNNFLDFKKCVEKAEESLIRRMESHEMAAVATFVGDYGFVESVASMFNASAVAVPVAFNITDFERYLEHNWQNSMESDTEILSEIYTWILDNSFRDNYNRSFLEHVYMFYPDWITQVEQLKRWSKHLEKDTDLHIVELQVQLNFVRASATAILNFSVEGHDAAAVLNKPVFRRWASLVFKEEWMEENTICPYFNVLLIRFVTAVYDLVIQRQYPKGLIHEIFVIIFELGLDFWFCDEQERAKNLDADDPFVKELRSNILISAFLSPCIIKFVREKN